MISQWNLNKSNDIVSIFSIYLHLSILNIDCESPWDCMLNQSVVIDNQTTCIARLRYKYLGPAINTTIIL